MRVRRTAIALLGALIALCVAHPFSASDSSSSPRVAITAHSIARAPTAPRRTTPLAFAVDSATVRLALAATRRAVDDAPRTPVSATPVAVASRGPPS